MTMTNPLSAFGQRLNPPVSTTGDIVISPCDPLARFSIQDVHPFKSVDHCQALVFSITICGLTWLREKYERLGAFPNHWGGQNHLVMHPCFHRQARDAAAIDQNDPEANALEQLYRSHVFFDVETMENEWQTLVDAGVCQEITVPSMRIQEVLPSSVIRRTETQRTAKLRPKEITKPHETTATPVPSMDKAWMLVYIAQQYL